MQEGRPKRVGEEVRREIAALLTKGLKDPRIGFISVMDVRMSTDLKYADVYLSLYGSESNRKSSLIAMQQASGWLRREIGRRIRLRYTPELRFHEDKSLEEVAHLEDVFKELQREKEKEGTGDE